MTNKGTNNSKCNGKNNSNRRSLRDDKPKGQTNAAATATATTTAAQQQRQPQIPCGDDKQKDKTTTSKRTKQSSRLE
jgi:hypothetical protein